jgi:hypothetical protein
MLSFFKRRAVIVILSILWGIGLASLIVSVSNMRNCIIVRGELPTEIEKKTFQYPGESEKCYRYKSKLAPCKQETHINVKLIDESETRSLSSQ